MKSRAAPRLDRARSLPAEHLDRYPRVPILILILAPFLGHAASWLTGLSSNPIWTESGAVTGIGRSIIFALDFSDPNVGWTNQALGHLAAQDWLHFIIPWWNPYSGIGLPLAGEMQPAALFLPFVLLLSFQSGIICLEISLQIFAGIATFALLRRLELGRLSALAGGLLFAFSGTFAWVPGETILNVMPFLPLLLHGIEDARDPAHQRRAIVLVGLGIGGSILAGFPETAYIDGVLALLWAVVRAFQVPDLRRFIGSITLGGVAGLLIASPQIIAFFDFSMASGVFATHQFGTDYINYRGFAVTVLPYVYGPLGMGAASPLLLDVSASTGGYVGLLLVLFGAAGFASRRDRPLVALLAVWIVLSLGKTFGFPPIMALVNAVPLMKNVVFSRYSSPSWELALIIPASFAIDDLRSNRVKPLIPLIVTLAILGLAIDLASPWAAAWHWHAAYRGVMVFWLVRALGFELIALGLVVIVWLVLRGECRRWCLAGLIVVNAMLLFIVPQLSGHQPGTLDRRGIDYLKSHLGLHRYYTLGPLDPNYSAYFRLPSLNHIYLPVAANWVHFVRHHLIDNPSFGNGDIFFAPFRPFSIGGAAHDIEHFQRDYRYLGVRYVLTGPDAALSPSMTYPAPHGRATALPLYPGQSVTVRGIAPPGLAAMPPISQIGVNQGNYDNTATGTMAMRLCSNGLCGIGSADLRRSHDNMPFTVPLAPAIPLQPGAAFTLEIDHISGTSPDAIWLYPASHSHLTTATAGTILHRSPEIAFSVRPDQALFRKVYTDKLMTIWRLAGAKPFYTTTGAACRIGAHSVNGAIIDCPAAATLIRRELFMAGWHATDNGAPVAIHVHHAVVQSIALHAGRNIVRFRFTPPYAGFAWLGFWLGALVLMWQMVGRWISPKGRHAQ
ncbi:glycosyltransferase family protein [Acidiphilium rubrum]|uniref:Membrane protein YfhO n=1 Tax=Acidiphilium rubrum TaxID=526 RepID=A0A8G2CIH8_ACIRU|nr:hypothetical protein [Acidiphilium rubrum]SIQ28667.1 hypothetical protein SAMN05421828_10386 [Acidiphilium rubrum]